MDRQSFVARYGGIFEYSPWIAAEAWEQGARAEKADVLRQAFNRAIETASRERKLELLRAHPPLACAIASGADLTGASMSEQHGAGLDRCSPVEFEEFGSLNRTYSNKFGFPFIIAVKGLGRRQILESFRARLQNSPDEEFEEALRQVMRIGALRLQALFEEGGGANGG